MIHQVAVPISDFALSELLPPLVSYYLRFAMFLAAVPANKDVSCICITGRIDAFGICRYGFASLSI